MKRRSFFAMFVATLGWGALGALLLGSEATVTLPLLTLTWWLIASTSWSRTQWWGWWVVMAVGVWSLYGVPLALALAGLAAGSLITRNPRFGGHFVTTRVMAAVAGICIFWSLVVRWPWSVSSLAITFGWWGCIALFVRWWFVRRSIRVR